MLEDPYHLIEGKLIEIRQKAIKIDKQWFPASVLKYGIESAWLINSQIEVEVAEWFLVENRII